MRRTEGGDLAKTFSEKRLKGKKQPFIQTRSKSIKIQIQFCNLFFWLFDGDLQCE